MGSGDKNFLNFHLHLHHHHHHHHHHHRHNHNKKEIIREIPKGCLAIMVGHEGEEQQRFIIPVIYINHPLFMQLLKEAEEEYGFVYHEGPINIPCHVEQFRNVQGLIDQENYHHHVWCFKT